MTEGKPLFSKTPLPAPPDGWFDYGYRVLMDGRLALIRTRNDIHALWRERDAGAMADSPLYTIPHPGIWATDAEWKDWYRAVEAAYAARPPDAHPRPGQGREATENEIRLSIFDGARESEPITVAHSHHALVDRTADEHWLVISPAATERSGPQEDSGTLYASDGRRIGALPLGDGIENLLCSPDGTIWAGYGHQSIYDPPDNDGGPLSRGGLVQFAARGAPIWAFNGNVEHNGGSLFVRDCPVMTLTGTTLWAWVPNIGRMTADAPATLLVRIRDGTVSLFASSLDDGREIAVAGDTLLVAGLHFEDANRIVAARIGETKVTGLGRVRVDEVARAGEPMRRWPEHLVRRLYEFDQDPGTTPRLVHGRDGILHAVTRAAWLRFGPKGVEGAVDPSDTPPFCRGFSGGWTVYAQSSLPPAPPHTAS